MLDDCKLRDENSGSVFPQVAFPTRVPSFTPKLFTHARKMTITQ